MNKLSEYEVRFPEKLKPLLKEDFPQHSDLFTSTLCSSIFSEGLRFACSKTNTNNEYKALLRLSSLLLKEKKKNGNRPLNDEVLSAIASQMPTVLQETLKEKSALTTFDRAMEFANKQALADMRV